MQLVHDFHGLRLAITRQGLDERGDFHATDDRVVLHVDDFCERQLAIFELIANLRAFDARRFSFFECGLAVCIAELRDSHCLSLFRALRIPAYYIFQMMVGLECIGILN